MSADKEFFLEREISKNAFLSPDRIYRYMLERQWDRAKPWVTFIGLNPSTADENKDDQTIRKCMAFARAWGMGGLQMLNLFSYRATKPMDMLAAYKQGIRPYGGFHGYGTVNNMADFIRSHDTQFVVAAWGTSSNRVLREMILERGRAVTLGLRHINIEMKYLNANKDGTPQHPLYIPLTMPLHQWK